MENASTKLLDDLTRSQNPDGSWQGILEKSGKPIVSSVWHTAQVIIVLNKIDSIKYKNSIDRAINWLITTQEKNGVWTAIHQYMIYFTSYALIALSIDKSSNEQAIINGYKYLKSRMNSSGRCSDLGGTIMCACALWELSDRKTKHEVSIIDFLINKRANYQVDQLISELKSTQNLYAQVKEKLDEYEEKYKDVVVTITKRWLSYIAIISFILTIIGFIFTIF